MKLKVLTFVMISLCLLIGLFIGTQVYKHDVKQKENEIEELKNEKYGLNESNKRLSELVKRQSKTVISDEEKQIRERSETFVRELFEMKKDTSFKSKSKELKPLLTDDYYSTLFDGKDRYNLYDDISVTNLHVYFDVFDPKQDSYKVFVQFDERIETDGQDKIENRKTSVQLDLVRTTDGWKVDNLTRFNLQRQGR
ncbi:hypothetical protein V132_00696 [Staphylococcus aureus ZTA10/00058-8HST]|uniref:hypothetical protein n=1 Tax=Staphylococcus aureus TaxID=1280 RepID=UPI0004534640|nr:hypothetical protein [Staphylococcus aureus]EZT73034.1 hypothetical protein V107_02564 [Staphylococcus aureus 45(2607)]EZW53354.1 hypothetical protein U970_01244 [Staphylococcus aureus 56824-10]EZX66243.1 hypothetical protein V017_00697 [Staphylococcus aureus C4668]KAH40983.1 hypothetical protein W700_00268 [Staphylococcus aureus VET1844R]KAH43338.1 hypothetical protein W701_00636 [Staphylococcus aureus VET1845R]